MNKKFVSEEIIEGWGKGARMNRSLEGPLHGRMQKRPAKDAYMGMTPTDAGVGKERKATLE